MNQVMCLAVKGTSSTATKKKEESKELAININRQMSRFSGYSHINIKTCGSLRPKKPSLRLDTGPLSRSTFYDDQQEIHNVYSTKLDVKHSLEKFVTFLTAENGKVGSDDRQK